jgi:hypothetical protein
MFVCVRACVLHRTYLTIVGMGSNLVGVLGSPRVKYLKTNFEKSGFFFQTGNGKQETGTGMGTGTGKANRIYFALKKQPRANNKTGSQ